ncbi:histone lysine acetyltransferase CREBBP-like [Leguminivora glycinivorella]|uniref:histone lysine acetyltransferase CREBBP-like n=1 Tax=Leguminivora glycinivorella TaxID=1035111 RepID=UPI00200E70FF|nr:histone lysine acetyltransferase CREBBP-like [Leguminivora glycinivorella]
MDMRPAILKNELPPSYEQAGESLQHANSCGNDDCSQQICLKIKAFKNHFPKCQQRSNCMDCKFLFKFFGCHAQSCTKVNCQTPFCFRIKQKMALKETLSELKRLRAVELLLDTISADRLEYFGNNQDKAVYARKVETYIYDRAFTLDEYYRLLAVKRWDVVMDIDEREYERCGFFWDRRDVLSKAVQTDEVHIVPITPEDH